MLDNLHYIHSVWLVVRPTMYFNLQAHKPLSVGQAAGELSMASNEDKVGEGKGTY